jgi:tripartite-type tricarboxylate transporter receptor subunit TctC
MRLVANLFAALLVLLTAQAGSAQSNYPNRPVKILVGFTPGTAPDLAARILADRFSDVWGTPFVVENVPGAGSNIATDRVAKAAADGYTLLMGGNSSLVINPSLYEQLPFDPIRISRRSRRCSSRRTCSPFRPSSRSRPWRSWWRSPRRSPANFPMAMRVGTSQHLGAELFKYMAHVDIAPRALSRHHGVDAGPARRPHHHVVRQYRERVPLAREGKLRALAITSIKRSALAPTCRPPWRSRIPGFEAVPWFGLLAPSGTPKDVLDKLLRRDRQAPRPCRRCARSSTNLTRAGRQHASRGLRRSSRKRRPNGPG